MPLPEDNRFVRVDPSVPDPNMIFAYGPPVSDAQWRDMVNASAAYAPAPLSAPSFTPQPDWPGTWEARGYGWPVAEPEKTLVKRISSPEFLLRWAKDRLRSSQYREMWAFKRKGDEIWLYDSARIGFLSGSVSILLLRPSQRFEDRYHEDGMVSTFVVPETIVAHAITLAVS